MAPKGEVLTLVLAQAVTQAQNHRGRKYNTCNRGELPISLLQSTQHLEKPINPLIILHLLINIPLAGRGSLCRAFWQVLWCTQAGMSQLQPRRTLAVLCKALSSAAPKTS